MAFFVLLFKKVNFAPNLLKHSTHQMTHTTTGNIHQKHSIQDWIAVLSCLMMIAGMLHARALVSIGAIALFLNACIPGTIKQHWATIRKSRLALWSALFFASYLVSGLWSSNTAEWASRIVIKLPFLLLPFGFLSLPVHKLNMLRILIYGISGLLLINISQSLYTFMQNPGYYIESYGSSKLIPTSIYNDYIRFSLALVLTTLLNVYLVLEHWTRITKWDKFLAFFFILVLTGFNHLLATKTGLLGFYIMIAILGFGKIYNRNKLVAVLFLLSLPVLGFLAYLKVPTIHAKIDYVQKEIEQANDPNAALDYNYSDQGRIISYQLALNIIKEHPVLGVGAGDLKKVMADQYAAHYPLIPEENRLIPHNQLLFVMVALGCVLSLIFILMIVQPIFSKGPGAVYAIATSAVLIFAMMAESMLEVQFGVLVYLFFVLFVWRLRAVNSPAAIAAAL